MDILDELIAVAPAHGARGVYPEGADPRIQRAAARLAALGVAQPVLLGDPGELTTVAAHAGISLDGLVLIDPRCDPRADAYAALCAAGPRRMDVRLVRRLACRALHFGALMLRAGDADAMIAGVVNPTSRVIEAGLVGIGLAAGVGTPSSYFLMLLRRRGRRRSGRCCTRIVP